MCIFISQSNGHISKNMVNVKRSIQNKKNIAEKAVILPFNYDTKKKNNWVQNVLVVLYKIL